MSEMRPTADLSPADWITSASIPFAQLAEFGPEAFLCWARLRFIRDPSGPGHQEADVELPENHWPDLVQVQHAVHILAHFTRTPQHCFFAVWEGYSNLPIPASVTAMLEIPHRRYLLLTGPPDGIDTFARDWGPAGRWRRRLSSGRSIDAGAWRAMSIRIGPASAPSCRPSRHSQPIHSLMSCRQTRGSSSRAIARKLAVSG